jgi:hypothetical protein
MKKLFAKGLLLAGIATQASAAFTGSFAPDQWFQSPGDGSVNVFTEDSLSITSGALGNESFTDVTIVFPLTGRVSFDWNYSTSDADGPAFDPFGVTIFDPFFLFTAVSDPLGANDQSGSFSLIVDGGSLFGFTAWSIDGFGGAATTRISNFSFERIPEPGTLALLAIALAAAGTTRRRQA